MAIATHSTLGRALATNSIGQANFYTNYGELVDVYKKGVYGSSWKPIPELRALPAIWDIIQCYVPPDTGECAPP